MNSQQTEIKTTGDTFGKGHYSSVSIKQVGWNKRVRWRKMENSIKELDGINKLVGKFSKSSKCVAWKIRKF